MDELLKEISDTFNEFLQYDTMLDMFTKNTGGFKSQRCFNLVTNLKYRFGITTINEFIAFLSKRCKQTSKKFMDLMLKFERERVKNFYKEERIDDGN